MGGWLRSSPSHAPPPPGPSHGLVRGFGGTWSATPLACHVCAKWADGYVALAGAHLPRSPAGKPSHGPGRGVERSLACHVDPPPLPRPSTYLGVGAVRVAMQVGVLGAFRVASIPFPLTVLPFFSSGSIVRPRAARCLLGPEATSSAPRTPRAFCRTFSSRRLPGMLWMAAAHPPGGGCALLYWRGLCCLKEWRSEGFEVSPTQPLPPCPGRTGLWFSAGPRQVVHLLLVSHLPTPCLCFHELGVVVLTVEQDLAVSSVPHHDRDSQVEDLPAGLWLLRLVRASPGPSHPLTSCASGVVGLDVFSELLHGKNGGPLNFWVPFSDRGGPQVPIACFPLTRCLLLSLW
ncbi:hypothetical protein GWK47_015470 [Chionoecetes opilio]|uniref:Uncharacterized protein n=1 Tax=Chionoecetes opilio TaxID=41210 RepID=A0A8J5CK55_CHIOP|nr:hypothetical protein GWK47_015470 [Chionoecetes opilio]